MSVALRRARPGDALPIRRLLRELGYEPVDTRSFDETLATVVRHPEAIVFVAVDGAEVLGYIAMSHRPQMRLGGRLAVVDEMVVTEARRGNGIGHTLLEEALKQARTLNCVRVEVAMQRHRPSLARGFYQRHGFVEHESATLRRDFGG